MRHRLITESPARVINKWQVEGGDVALLPVGSSEAVGPHLPLGARGFVAEAFSYLMAEAVEGLVLPTLPLAPVMGTLGRGGTVDVAEKETNAVLRSVMDDLAKTGFRRIILVTYLEYAAYYLPAEFWEDNGTAAAGVDLNDLLEQRTADKDMAHDCVVLGALRILGREKLVARCVEAHKRLRESGWKNAPLPGDFEALSKVGKVGVVYPKGYFPMPPAEVLDVDEGARLLREMVEELAPCVEALRKYNEFLVKRSSRGLLKGNWFRS